LYYTQEEAVACPLNRLLTENRKSNSITLSLEMSKVCQLPNPLAFISITVPVCVSICWYKSCTSSTVEYACERIL